MEQLIYEINKKKYLLFSVLVLNKNQSTRMLENIKKYDGIIQSYNTKEQTSFWDSKKLLMNVLIPEENAIKFSNET